MRYIDVSGGGSYPFPNHAVNPDKKNAQWCMEYAKAAYYQWSNAYPKGVFANNAGDYQKWRMYALGKQPITPYKKWLGVDQLTNNTWLSVDWTVRPIVSQYRDRAISRMMKQDYGIVATPIDMLAQTEVTQYYNEMRVKLAIRDLMLQQNPELASHPMITLQSGEPLDVEELAMRIDMGEQFNRAKDAELAIELGFFENNYTAVRRALYEDLFDYGVAGVKDWLGDDNKAKFRRVNPDSVVVSYCKDATFSDMVHAGELIDVPLVEMATITDKEGNLVFTESELQEFASSLAGKFGNPAVIGSTNGWLKPYDKFKCKVLDMEFFTYNEYSFNDAYDENGNSDFRKADYGRGKKSSKYKRKKIQFVYKVKWVVGTDKVYDWGMCYDQKRATSTEKKAKTKLSYTFCAYNFYEMKAQSFMERLVPYLDEYQLTVLKIQNWKNRSVPSGWWINLDMLENVALSKGGAAMQPKELLQMYFETGIMVGRGLDAGGNPFPGNIQPVIPIENSSMQELAALHQDLLATVMMIEKITGYNDATLGQANAKTLVPGYELANQATEDALYPMMYAEESVSLKLAYNVLCRMQQGIKKGGISGYASAINTNTLRFIEVSPEISLREYGIELQKRTTEQEKMWIMQQIQQDIANGLLDVSDAILIINTHNAKQSMQILAYKVKKAKERAQQYELQKMQMQSEGNAQVAQASEQAKMQGRQMEIEAELQKEQMRIMGELKKEEMRLQAELQMKAMELGAKQQMNTESNDAKQAVAGVTAEAKIIASSIDHESKQAATDLAGQYQMAKQREANKKGENKAK